MCIALTSINSFICNPTISLPTLGTTVFSRIDKTTCILHVPIGQVANYRALAQWSDFVNIVDDL